ncbi:MULTISPECIES: aggregation-promoting factor C-terminal-like domain-containing protein [Streptomyces]|uniref:aggregation-promoting factor C-terminal-like domain-containing protein n=1 Tax=Streptomyces TaxID=1883 RepID=UPI001587A87B|nr:transglycosylase SLT domain-containing protein [Streptomyces sp. CAI-85]MBO7935397.1 transglycosylase SLT domain-containing protein [Streptomyces sp. S9]NUV64679.1 transglycosylase SLT domain-containing protein [Streptomyces sp. CAI-85]
MSRNPVRGFAVVSATAVTAIGSVVGVAQAGTGQPGDAAQAPAGDSVLLADLPLGQQAQVRSAALGQQAQAQAVAADATARKSAEEAARIKAAEDAVAKQKAAADEAEAKKEAEERAKAAEREADQAQARTRSATADSGPTASASDFPQQASYTVAEVQAIARQMVPGGQFQCFSNIVDHESTWNYRAVNPSSGAYGLVQAYPGSKMSSAGADWRTNPATQIKWGLNYMNERYGSPCDAWAFWQANGSY